MFFRGYQLPPATTDTIVIRTLHALSIRKTLNVFSTIAATSSNEFISDNMNYFKVPERFRQSPFATKFPPPPLTVLYRKSFPHKIVGLRNVHKFASYLPGAIFPFARSTVHCSE
jgi:hypothetical protein